MEGIVLAGGFGTRLRAVVADVPKCLAPVAGKPFLAYLLASLERAGFDHIILSLGYKYELVERWLSTFPTRMRVDCVVESEPLGTGGAVKFATQQATEADVFILNGDTFFEVDYTEMAAWHRKTGAEATLALRKMTDFDRYGIVETDGEARRIVGFREKAPCAEGWINGGTYLVRREALQVLPDRCSLEKAYFETHYNTAVFTGYLSDGYFIDLGIPEDYARIQEDFRDCPAAGAPQRRFTTLFLDRDGVINRQRPGDYVKNTAELEFLPGALEALRLLAGLFPRIVIVTNQRGVGKGVMTQAALDAVHAAMLEQIGQAGGRIDRIYCCTAVEPEHPMRKPNPGMALQACRENPEIRSAESVMAGDSVSDLLFARNSGLYSVFIDSKAEKETVAPELYDERYPDLLAFAHSFRAAGRVDGCW